MSYCMRHISHAGDQLQMPTGFLCTSMPCLLCPSVQMVAILQSTAAGALQTMA